MGARIDDWVDERRHVQASTRLAARLLKENYRRFGSWHLALAAYNAGAGTVSRAIKKGGTNDYWRLIRAGLLPREASNYVPKAIASMIAIRRPDLIGLEAVVLNSPIETAIVSVASGTDILTLAKGIGVSSTRILALNPHLRRAVTPPDGEDFALVVPTKLKSRVESWVRRQDSQGGEVFETIKIRFGERLQDIAWQRRLSLRRLRLWNDLNNDDQLEPGASILVPANRPVRSFKDLRLIGRQMPDFNVKGRTLHWFPVLYSQPLGPIAAWFGTTSNNLRLWNDLADEDWVTKGLAIRIWVNPTSLPAHTLRVERSALQLVPKSKRVSSLLYRPGTIEVVSHRIRRGDNLWRIAKKYQTPVAAIRSENLEDDRLYLVVGETLNVPTYRKTKVKGKLARRSAKPIGDGGRYTVRRGDSLWKIASRFRTNVAKLRRMNRLSKRAILRVGQRLRVPGR